MMENFSKEDVAAASSFFQKGRKKLVRPGVRSDQLERAFQLRVPVWDHIFSGASTPRSFNPFFSTLLAASASSSRARSSSGSSPLMRQAV